MRSSLIDLIFLFLILLRSCRLQKTGGDSKRHDVYIAGFFPFGKGVENSETGKNSIFCTSNVDKDFFNSWVNNDIAKNSILTLNHLKTKIPEYKNMNLYYITT